MDRKRVPKRIPREVPIRISSQRFINLKMAQYSLEVIAPQRYINMSGYIVSKFTMMVEGL